MILQIEEKIIRTRQTIMTSKIPNLGIEFKQTRFTVADPWNPLVAIHWDMTFASDKKK